MYVRAQMSNKQIDLYNVIHEHVLYKKSNIFCNIKYFIHLGICMYIFQITVSPKRLKRIVVQDLL